MTDKKSALIELLYALDTLGCFDNEKISLHKSLFDVDGVAVITLVNKLLPDSKHHRPEIVETGVYLRR